MKKILAFLIIIIGLVTISLGLYFQKDNNQDLNQNKIDWKLNTELEVFCPNYKLLSYDLNNYNYTSSKIQIADCLKQSSSSSFVRNFSSEDKKVKIEITVKKIENIKHSFTSQDLYYQDDIYMTKSLTENRINYEIAKLIDKDIYYTIKIDSEDYAISEKFIEDLLKIDYNKKLVSFKKLVNNQINWLIVDYQNDDSMEVFLKFPKHYEEEDLIYADQKIQLKNEKAVVNIEVFIAEHGSCSKYLKDADEKDGIFYKEDGNKIKACKTIKDQFLYIVNSENIDFSELSLFFDFEIIE